MNMYHSTYQRGADAANCSEKMCYVVHVNCPIVLVCMSYASLTCICKLYDRYIFIYIYIYLYIYIHIYIYTYIHIYIHACRDIHTYKKICMCIQIHVCVFVCIDIRRYATVRLRVACP